MQLLDQLLYARGASGEEREVRTICRAALQGSCDEVWSDEAGNLIGLIRSSSGSKNATLVLAHLDEIAMAVKRIEPDGTLRVVALGGANPVNFGMCPVDIMAEDRSLPGVLSFGTMHATSESPQGIDAQKGNVQWKDVHVVTRMTPQELSHQGVRPGTRVVLSRHWRTPFKVGDAIAAHFMDDRAPILAVLQAANALSQRRDELLADVYFVCTTMEEETNAGALFAAHHLPGATAIAVEVGPVAAEYQTRLAAEPIVVAGDEKGHYTRSVTDALIGACSAAGYDAQVALLIDFASDASAILSAGAKGRAGCIAIPTENTHGFEIVIPEAITACTQALVEYLVKNPRKSSAERL